MIEKIEHSRHVACICEGPSEVCVVDMLLNRGALAFGRSQLLTGKPLGSLYFRSQTRFTGQFLGMDYGDDGLVLLVVQDRKNASYEIRPPYSEKISCARYVVTAPEIEMLMVHSCNLYDKYKKQKEKPSVFMAQQLKVKTSKLKSRGFVEDFYRTYDLIEAIREHKRKGVLSGKRVIYLADLLKR